MVSYAELIQIGILIIALIALIFEIYQNIKK